ncbi:MAG: ABC transporter ATP-binding protein [Planctomycetota bacterium]
MSVADLPESLEKDNLRSAPSKDVIVRVRDLVHRYGDREALAGLDLQANRGEIVALLGPNGSGKTTLFRLLSTMIPVQYGSIEINGLRADEGLEAVRRSLGIVFQSPSLDKKLTVWENLKCQAALYGLRGKVAESKMTQRLEQLGLSDRRNDSCESLSGGLRRRVELAKGLLHEPSVLLLDEPSTGLDPSARLDFWAAIQQMADDGVAVLMTTHLIEEASKADRVVLMDQGRKVADDSPVRLCDAIGRDVLVARCKDPSAAAEVAESMGLEARIMVDQIRIEIEAGDDRLGSLLSKIRPLADSMSWGPPSLEDVFIERTGHAYELIFDEEPVQ